MKIKTKSHFLTEEKAKKLSPAKAKSLGWSIQNRCIRKGDKVIVISGDHRGSVGEVLSRTSERAIVQGVNIKKKHVKGSQSQPGRILELERPLHVSNLKLQVEEK